MLNYFFPLPVEEGSEAVAAQMITQSFMNTKSYLDIFRGTEESRKEPMEFVFRRNLLMIKEHSSDYMYYHFSADGSTLECFFMLVPNNCATFTLFEKIFKGGIFEYILRYDFQSIVRLIRVADRSDAILDEIMKDRPKYYKLQRMVVNASMQGTGIGSKHLGNALKKADEEQLPVVLDTQDARNVTFYGRL
jgi:GNAT superfamily N-acetyltransferase